MIFDSRLLLFFVLGLISAESNGTHASTIRECQEKLGKADLFPLSGTVGMGWDNLRNLPMAQVLQLTFSKCLTTPDGQFLIADDMEIISIKSTNLDKIANFYDQWKEYLNQNSFKINQDLHLPILPGIQISGSFNDENEFIKQKFLLEKAKLFRTTLEHKAYRVLIQSSTLLNQAFIDRVLSIKNALKEDLPAKARLLAQLLIRDYGTHLITSADLGAKLIKEDYMSRSASNFTEDDLSDYRIAASLQFYQIIGANSSFTRTPRKRTNEAFEKKLIHSRIRTLGGPRVNKLLLEQSALEVEDLIVIDRDGSRLDTIINQITLPSIDSQSIQAISEKIREAIETYYRANKIEGCMDPESPSFDAQANVNGSCKDPNFKRTFGGFYQTCQIVQSNPGDWDPETRNLSNRQHLCDPFIQINQVTGSFDCGDLHDVVEILNTSYPVEITEKSKLLLFFTQETVFKYNANVSTVYCRAKEDEEIPKQSGQMFGGFFKKGQLNPFTGSSSCPKEYETYKIFRDSSICLSRNFAVAGQNEIKFDGFFSCQSVRESSGCAEGFTQHLASVENGCDVLYCVKPQEFTRYLPSPIRTLPFEDLSALSSNVKNTIAVYENQTLIEKYPANEIINSITQKGDRMKSFQFMDMIEVTKAQVTKFIKEKLLDEMNQADDESSRMNMTSVIGAQSMGDEMIDERLLLCLSILIIIVMGFLILCLITCLCLLFCTNHRRRRAEAQPFSIDN